MSTVLLAFDRRLERYVAVKLLAEHLADDTQFVSRFRREALAAARLVHPNIVQVFDFGLDEHDAAATTSSWSTSAASRAPRSCATRARSRVDDALDVVDAACRGLRLRAPQRRRAPRRQAGQPAALRRGRGQARRLRHRQGDRASRAITQVGSVLGTAAYLAPEQARGEEAGPRADLYALGVVTYQLLAGRLPYEATSLTELALKQQREEPPLLDELVAAVPPALADAVERALALEPARPLRERRGDAPRAASTARDGVAPTRPARDAAAAPRQATRAIRRRSPSRPRGRRRRPQAPRSPPRPAPPAPARPAPRHAEPRRGATRRRRPRAAPLAGARRCGHRARRGGRARYAAATAAAEVTTAPRRRQGRSATRRPSR